MQVAKRFWIAAVCTLGLLIGTSAVRAQEGKDPPKEGGGPATSTKLLPNDTEMVVIINLQQILKSEVLKDKKELVDLAKMTINQQFENQGVDKYLKTAGFDIFTDLHTITYAMPGGRNPEESVIIVEGKFDAAKIEAAMMETGKDKGVAVKEIKLANIKAFEVNKPGEKTGYVAVLSKKTMIMCQTKADFAETVARYNGTKTSKIKGEMKSLLETVNNSQSLSVVTTTAVLAKLAENAPENAADKAKMAAMALQKVEGISLAITVQKNVDFQVGGNAKDAKTASDLANSLNLAVGLMKASINEKAKQDEKFLPAAEVVNTIRLTAVGSNLVLRGQISYETLGKVLANIPLPK